jgi:hypothetical protein
MDSGYEQETIGDVTFPVVAPLGVNSLLQRIGRVGRKRPGIAYIASEVDADYAELEDDELNDRQTLAYEPIVFPLAGAPLMPLAYYACQQGWPDISTKVADLDLPSKLHQNPVRMAYLREQIATLETLGLTHNGQLTPLGESMEKWIGQADLAYAVQLQKKMEEDAPFSEIVFWLVATALSNAPITTLRAKYDFFIDYDGKHSELPHSIDVWPHNALHEDLAAFSMIATVASAFPQVLWQASPLTRSLDDDSQRVFERWCNLAGIDPRKLLHAVKAIRDTWKLFCRINGESSAYKAVFSNVKAPELPLVEWKDVQKYLPLDTVWRELRELPGSVTVRLAANDLGGFTWTDTLHGYEGLLS